MTMIDDNETEGLVAASTAEIADELRRSGALDVLFARIDTGEVWTFVPVAAVTGECKI